jgi:acid phosphatase type 7
MSAPHPLRLALAAVLFSAGSVFVPAMSPATAPTVTPPDEPAAPFEPATLILTWRQDPTTTIVIDWHQQGDAPAAAFTYGPADAPADTWQSARPEPARPFPFAPRRIYRVELTGLQPDTRYAFRLADSETFTFRTLPARLTRPVTFVVGGDNMHEREWFTAMNRAAAARAPDFIIWGGDLAYEDGQIAKLDRMIDYVDIMRDTLRAPDGRIIPVVVGIGNHEVRGGYWWNNPRGREGWTGTDAAREEIAPYFYALWAFPGHPGYGVLDLGDYASIIMLDTDHSGPIEGKQTEWLDDILRARSLLPHVLPVYHVPAYPSVRAFEGQVSVRVREHWVPLFEQAGVRVAFEHHDHAYKRTHPLRAGESHPEGIVYVGDGSWGVNLRELREQPYIARAEREHHGIHVTLHADRLDLEAVNSAGEVFDQFTIPARR